MNEKSVEENLDKLCISNSNGVDSHEQNSEESSCQKRQDYLPWEDYFLAVAFLSAMRSKDPSTQVKQLFFIYPSVFCPGAHETRSTVTGVNILPKNSKLCPHTCKNFVQSFFTFCIFFHYFIDNC